MNCSYVNVMLFLLAHVVLNFAKFCVCFKRYIELCVFKHRKLCPFLAVLMYKNQIEPSF